MKEHVVQSKVPHCKKCNGLVKPDIVFFGEGVSAGPIHVESPTSEADSHALFDIKLPDEFGEAATWLAHADLLIIMGTSLTVYPFAGLRNRVPESCPRVLINLDKVGEIGSRSDDVVLLMECDEAVKKICKEIGDGWPEELERLWKETENSYTPRESVVQPSTTPGAKEGAEQEKEGKRAHLNAKLAQIYKDGETRLNEEDKQITPAGGEATSEMTSTGASTTSDEPKAEEKVEEPREVDEPATADDKFSTPHYEDAQSQPIMPGESGTPNETKASLNVEEKETSSL